MRTPAQQAATAIYNSKWKNFGKLNEAKKEARRLKKNREQQELRALRRELTY